MSIDIGWRQSKEVRMNTMSLYESGDSSGVISLKDLCEQKFQSRLLEKVSLEKLPINTIDNTTVYITPQGKKYHHYECQCIKGRNDLTKTTISESKDKGCEPCGVCFRNKK